MTEGQDPNPEWEAKLDKLSKKFGNLKKKAAEWVGKDDDVKDPALKSRRNPARRSVESDDQTTLLIAPIPASP